MRYREKHQRKGAVMVEAAVVFPLVLSLMLAIILGGTAVFYFQQLALQSQEAARWTSVRGANYQKETGQSSPTQQQILQQVVTPMGINMDASQLTCSAQWVNAATNVASDWDSSKKDVLSINASGEYVTNRVRVTVTYTWSPGVWTGPLTMTCVSEYPMSY